MLVDINTHNNYIRMYSQYSTPTYKYSTLAHTNTSHIYIPTQSWKYTKTHDEARLSRNITSSEGGCPTSTKQPLQTLPGKQIKDDVDSMSDSHITSQRILKL